jgi:hypothetical protein
MEFIFVDHVRQVFDVALTPSVTQAEILAAEKEPPPQEPNAPEAQS